MKAVCVCVGDGGGGRGGRRGGIGAMWIYQKMFGSYVKHCERTTGC